MRWIFHSSYGSGSRRWAPSNEIWRRAAEVTESYISQLLTGKKAPPAPERTDIYDKMEGFLRLPPGQLVTLAQLIRSDTLKRKIADPPAPLFREVRELILRKCAPAKVQSIRAIFVKEPFGALERLVTQKLLDVVKRVTKDESRDKDWLRLVARHSDRSYEQMRVMVIEFLEVDVFNVSADNSLTFLDPLIESWDIDLVTFGMEIVLESPARARSSEEIRIRRARVRGTGGAREGLHRFPAGSGAERRCHRGGNRISRAADIHRANGQPPSTTTASCKTCVTHSAFASCRPW